LRQELASIKEEKRFAFDELMITKADLKTLQRENNILKQKLKIRREDHSITPIESTRQANKTRVDETNKTFKLTETAQDSFKVKSEVLAKENEQIKEKIIKFGRALSVSKQ
jgi:hypothetical protein